MFYRMVMSKQKDNQLKQLEAIEKLFRALANGRRLQIVRLLAKRPYSVAELSQKLKLSYKATHQHVYRLFMVELLDKERDGLLVQYSIENNLSNVAERLLQVALDRKR